MEVGNNIMTFLCDASATSCYTRMYDRMVITNSSFVCQEVYKLSIKMYVWAVVT